MYGEPASTQLKSLAHYTSIQPALYMIAQRRIIATQYQEKNMRGIHLKYCFIEEPYQRCGIDSQFLIFIWFCSTNSTFESNQDGS